MKFLQIFFLSLCLVIALGVAFFPFRIIFATSGACSGHGGVSCGAGPDRDGSVICQDGWRNSSVQYSSMASCKSVVLPRENIRLTTPTPSTSLPVTQYATLTAGAKLFSTSSTKSKLIATLKKGARYPVVGKSSGWVKIAYTTKLQGWVQASYVSLR